MPTAILRPTAVGFYDQWALTAGASKQAAVDPGDPVSHDDNTSYITGTAGTFQHESYTLTATPAGVTTINSVSLGQRSQVDAAVGGPAGVVSFLRATSGLEGYINTAQTVGSWQTVGPTNSPKPGTSDFSWALADLTGLEIGVFLSPGAGGANGLCTSVWIELSYSASRGGFIFLMSQLLPLIGSGLSLSHMPRVAALLARRGIRLAPDEYLPALDAWKGWARPTGA